MPLPIALSQGSASYRSLIEIWVILGASTAETLSRTSRFGVGIPLALHVLGGSLAKSQNITR